MGCSRRGLGGAPAAAFTLVLWSSACAPRVVSSPPTPDPVSMPSCLAVAPFENQTTFPLAGDLIAETVASALVVSDRYSVVEPTEVRGMLDARGQRVLPIAAADRARKLGESLGVDAVVGGTVFAYSSPPPGQTAPVAFSVILVETSTGAVLWTGEVAYDAAEGLRPAALAGVAQSSADALVRLVTAPRAPQTSRPSCARPRAPVLASKARRPATAALPTAAALAWLMNPKATQPRPAVASTGGLIPAPSPPAPAARAEPASSAPASEVPSSAADTTLAAHPAPGAIEPLPSLPDLPALPAAPAPTAASRAAPDLPAASTPTPTPVGAATTPAAEPLPALPTLPDLPPGPAGKPGPDAPSKPGDTALPALPDLPASGGDALPALPAEAPPADLPPLPGVPELPADSSAPAADEYAGLPFAPAAPEPPPTTKARLSGRQKALLRQLYVGTGLTRRWFRKAQILPQANAMLGDINGLLKAVPDLKLVFEVSADLGTQTTPSKQLSDRQAQVLQKLVETRYPAAKGRVFFRSLGNTRPLAKDINARARAQNTRIEVRRVY